MNPNVLLPSLEICQMPPTYHLSRTYIRFSLDEMLIFPSNIPHQNHSIHLTVRRANMFFFSASCAYHLLSIFQKKGSQTEFKSASFLLLNFWEHAKVCDFVAQLPLSSFSTLKVSKRLPRNWSFLCCSLPTVFFVFFFSFCSAGCRPTPRKKIFCPCQNFSFHHFSLVSAFMPNFTLACMNARNDFVWRSYTRRRLRAALDFALGPLLHGDFSTFLPYNYYLLLKLLSSYIIYFLILSLNSTLILN